MQALEETGRTDPTVVRLFLLAALSADEGIRRTTLEAARTSGDPPMPGGSGGEGAAFGWTGVVGRF